TRQAHRKAADYTLVKGRFGLLSLAVGSAVLLGWTLLGGLDFLNSTLRDAVLPRWGALPYQLALLTAFAVIGSLIELPLDWYATFRIEQRFGFNRMTPALWLADLAKGAVLGALIGLPLAALILWIMGSSGGLWWLWAWFAWVAFNLLLLVLYPTVIAPLFNKFEPLPDEALKARVQALMRRCGFAAKGLFVMDGSRRSAHANAYFTGLGAAKRVVFFDTLLRRLSPGEVEAVLAHELGHFKRRHVLKRMAGVFGLSLAGLALLGWLAGNSGFYAGLGVAPSLAAPNDALALILFMLVLPSFTFFISPLMAHFSRAHEFEADAYACAQADGRDLASALLKLHEDNAATLTPDPLYVRFYYSHPPASERLAALPRPADGAAAPA
ncbi:MAG: M48 family metallopeptidase, partial [Chitinophagaceae bacterium]|nr:M48 family metallopeptidase [Rubrivivax sp.]